MVKINLKKLISKKDVASVVSGAIAALDEIITIQDAKGVILVGSDSQLVSPKYPIAAASEVIGWVIGSDRAVFLAEMLSYIAKTELEKKSLAQETLSKYEEINFLYDFSSLIATCQGIQSVTELVILETKKLINATHVSVMLLNEKTGALEAIAAPGADPKEKTVMRSGEGIAGHVLASGKAEIVNDVLSDSRYIQEEENEISSLICTPLTIGNETIGVMKISNTYPVNYTAEDLKMFAALTTQAAAAIKNALLYEQLKDYSHTLEMKVAERTVELEKAMQELHRHATLDGLTQVANRRQFDSYLSQQWEKLARDGLPLSLILCDVDYFKRYNDTYGHQAGDDCLRKIAQAISSAVKNPAYLVARYGGEEFAVIMPNTSIKGAVHIAEAIKIELEWLNIPHEQSKVSKSVTVSMGVSSTIPTNSVSPSALIAITDAALYEAKKQGRDRLIFKFWHSDYY
ncbi:MAG: diguanylate cyclase [Hormoscilla sp.]